MKTIGLLILSSLLTLLTACSTIEGVGKDIQDGAKFTKKQLGGDVNDK